MAVDPKEIKKNRKTFVNKKTKDEITTGSLSDISYLKTHGYTEKGSAKQSTGSHTNKSNEEKK